jgi:hypothetical protein
MTSLINAENKANALIDKLIQFQPGFLSMLVHENSPEALAKGLLTLRQELISGYLGDNEG